MSTETERAPWKELEELAARGDSKRLEEYLKSLEPGEPARAISRLPEEDQRKILTALSPEGAADLVDELHNVQAVELFEALEPQQAASIVEQLESDEQADLLSELEEGHAEAILEAMRPAEAADARLLTSYESDVAGGLMVREYLAYPQSSTAGDVIRDLRAKVEEYRDYDVQYVYVITPEGKLCGVLRLRDLLLTRESMPVAEFMIRDPMSVHVETSLDDLDAFFDRHALIGVPVVDAEGKLVGVVQHDDVEEARGDRADSDYLKSQGIVGGEEFRSMPLLFRARRRLSWLSANILLNILAASVIAFFEETLTQVIALAVFLPIISDMSGNSGNQALAVSVREMTLGMLKPNELGRVCLKEWGIGIINGIALGLLVALAAWIWKGNPYLGLVVGAAMAVNTLIAVLIGGSLPLILKQLGQDPALASGPLLTTVTDMCGFFLVLGLAYLSLPLLV